MGERLRGFDWASHPLGPPHRWPSALRMATSLCLNSTFPTAVYWGPQFHLLYNDAWSPIPGERHPTALGQPAREVWSDIWSVVGPQFERVLTTGAGVAEYEQMLPMVRGGVRHETWWNYSLTALRNADNSVGGLFNQGNEITDVVRSRRRREAEIDHWRELFQQAPAGVALVRGPEHVYEIANDAYRRLLGGRDVQGRRVKDAVPEAEAQGFTALLDGVYRTGEPYLGSGVTVKLERAPGRPAEERILDFLYQPVRDGAGRVDGVFVLVTDVTERARAEAALRISNWQLGEERARLAATAQAEQRSHAALRRFNETLEAEVKRRTALLERTAASQAAIADRLRATFETGLLYQGFLDAEGILKDTNGTSLEAIRATLEDVVGRPFWDTPWFAGTSAMPERIREAVGRAMQGYAVRQLLDLDLPIGRRRFDFSLRPVLDARNALIGIVPEAVDITDRQPAA